jgi:8-oxo-dGTP pyrophosphatase MutT (NUDIX family)
MKIDYQGEPLFVDETEAATPREGQPYVERDAITAVVRDPKNGKVLGLRWKQVDWETFITGGIEEGQTAEEAARMEILEETGYKNLKLVKELPPYHAKFYHPPKGVNRFAHFTSFVFELIDDERDELAEGENQKHAPVWLTPEELATFRLPEGHRFLVGFID